jgi:glycine cleavage system transcriptional repressor
VAQHLAVTVIGSDRPGIVAAVTGALVDRDCNLSDTSMSILRGQFAMMLVVAAPDATTPEELEGALGDVARSLGLGVTVRPIEEQPHPPPPGETWSLSVYGADHPGIVHRVSRLLADRGVNIIDLDTRVIGDPQRPVYAMVLDVSVPPGLDPERLEHDLTVLAGELEVDCSLNRAEADLL